MLLVLLVGGLLSSTCLAMDAVDQQQVEESENDEEEAAQAPVVTLTWDTISDEEIDYWDVIMQEDGTVLNQERVYESIKRIIEIRGNTPFRFNNIDNDLLLVLIDFKRISSIEDCLLDNILTRDKIPNLGAIEHLVNLMNYIQHHFKRYLMFCNGYLKLSIVRMIEDLGSERRRRLNQLGDIYFREPVQERPTTGLSKFVTRFSWNWEGQYQCGSNEHRALYQVKFKELFEETCEKVLGGIMPWIQINQRLYQLRIKYVGDRRMLGEYMSKWLMNTYACDQFSQMQDPNHDNFKLTYDKYVRSKMSNPQAQLYPGT